MEHYNFREFLDQWNKIQHFETPSIHMEMADWLQNCYETGQTRLLLMAFRASGKSTIVGLFSAWLLLRQPDFRILVLAAESNLASKMVRNVKRIIERHPKTKHLIPDKKDQWASDRFTVSRDKELRDPSVLASGITGNFTGSRADIIIYDDVEVPNTSNSPDKREGLRERLRESNFILVPGGTQLYVGTPHSYFSIYAKNPRQEVGEVESFLCDFLRYEQPVLNKDNKSVWPLIFTEELIEQIKRQSGPNKFAAQMMLKPINVINGRLNTSLLNFYNEEISYIESRQRISLSLKNKRIVSCSAWWDPAFGREDKGDGSVIAIIFSDEEGHYYLHHLSYIKVKARSGEDEASLQCKHVVDLVKKFFIPSICIEINGIGKFLPSILRRELAIENVPCAVIEKSSVKSKSIRILEAFDAIMAAQALSVHDSVKDTPFILEMMEWRPDNKYMKDDGMDAVSGALSQEPIRIQRSVITAKRKWFTGDENYQAETDFKI